MPPLKSGALRIVSSRLFDKPGRHVRLPPRLAPAKISLDCLPRREGVLKANQSETRKYEIEGCILVTVGEVEADVQRRAYMSKVIIVRRLQ
jgi:hypothetical protein